MNDEGRAVGDGGGEAVVVNAVVVVLIGAVLKTLSMLVIDTCDYDTTHTVL